MKVKILLFLLILPTIHTFEDTVDVSSWKDKNIRRLHLVAGVIILALGAAMILGWV